MLRRIRHLLGKLVRGVIIFYYRRMGIKIGERVFISSGAWLDTRRGNIIIGDNVTITNGCKILSHDMTAHIMKKPGNGQGVTTIGKNVFVGMNSIILSGVTVGDGAIIGAGSIIPKNVPANCVVIGSGARIVKRKDPVTGEWRSVDEAL